MIQQYIPAGRWKAIVAPYEEASVWKGTWQIVNSFGSYLVLWALMYLSRPASWWLTLTLAVVAGTLLIRVFVILHDCGHGSFFRSRVANDVVGFAAGVLTFTPYDCWRQVHSHHHATTGNLDRRGRGDIWTMTVREYRESSRWKRIAYRLVRNPFVLFGIAPVFLFVIAQRFPRTKAGSREWKSVWWTNLGVVLMSMALTATFGFGTFVLIQLTIMLVAGGAGVWFFYVQHQFEAAYWERSDDWDYAAAALKGSSFYRLPKPLQWLSGNIGFHHVHHLSPRIPNYNLQRCHHSHPLFLDVKALTLRSSLATTRLRLWDEQLSTLVSFKLLTTPQPRKGEPDTQEQQFRVQSVTRTRSLRSIRRRSGRHLPQNTPDRTEERIADDKLTD